MACRFCNPRRADICRSFSWLEGQIFVSSAVQIRIQRGGRVGLLECAVRVLRKRRASLQFSEAVPLLLAIAVERQLIDDEFHL